jgi:hypothetical protein
MVVPLLAHGVAVARYDRRCVWVQAWPGRWQDVAGAVLRMGAGHEGACHSWWRRRPTTARQTGRDF